MNRVTWRNLVVHRRRFIGTFLAALLGVAFLTGTLVLVDTLNRNFDNLFTQSTAGTDAVVRSTSDIKGGSGPDEMEERGLVDAALVNQMRAVNGVAVAEGQVTGYGQLLGANGNAVGGNGPPRTAGNWLTDPALNPYRLVEGRAPRADNEVVINKGAATSGKLHVGDWTTVQTPQPVHVHIVGIATFGSEPGIGGTTFTAFTLHGAQRYILGQSNRVSQVVMRVQPGVSQSTVVQRVRAALPKGTEALTGAAYEHEVRKNLSFLTFFRVFLSIFAGVALLVGAFSIYNTFAIVLAQRTRESALLRAVGASRRQLLRSVVFEVVAVGVIASLAGFALGLGVAGLLKGMFDAFGFDLPAGGLVVTGTAFIVSVLVGVVVTLVAGLAPALRASRVAPIAALQESAAESTHMSRGRIVTAAALLGVGAALVVAGLVGNGTGALTLAGIGDVLVLAGVVTVAPLIVAPVARFLGAPIARTRGVAGALARDNSIRNPRRTASTASALVIGIAVVTLFTVFGASLRAQIDKDVSGSFAGDLVVNSPSFGGGALSPKLASDVAKVPDVATAVGVGNAVATLDGKGTNVTVAEPRSLAGLLDLDVRHGSIAALGTNGIAVSQTRADKNDWHVGSTVRLGFSDRSIISLRVGAIYKQTDLVGPVLVPRVVYTPHAVQATDSMVLVDVRSGVSIGTAKAAIKRAVHPYGDPDVQDRKEFIASAASGADLFLGIVYVMLALAIVIALMGIANTMSLAVHERGREIGLLRAVGQTRSQVRAMVRGESVIVAMFGTLTGVAMGVFLAWAVLRAGSSNGLNVFSAPLSNLGLVFAIGTIAGLFASVRPARRAARVPVMTALVSP